MHVSLSHCLTLPQLSVHSQATLDFSKFSSMLLASESMSLSAQGQQNKKVSGPKQTGVSLFLFAVSLFTCVVRCTVQPPRDAFRSPSRESGAG